ncbi:MAG TPA: PHP domain-containing protein [bacterium]|nr:PHP domain-containing protein [bacterium]
MSKYAGLKFQKFDLHVHTPASHDFKDRKITPEQIFSQALKTGLKGIAITDHNTGQYI